MAAGDHLDNEVSVAVRLDEAGIGASARSRTFAAIDRLCGATFEWMSLPLEEKNIKRRARIDAEHQMYEAAAKAAVALIGADERAAERAFRMDFQSVLRKQENKDQVAQEALEDLRNSPPTDAEEGEVPQNLAPSFLSRFEEYAEGASTDELRQRWGRVLASEIRKPGTFSHKVMRIVDELSSDAAIAFEESCLHRIGNDIPICIHGIMDFATKVKLESSGLLVDPGLTGQIRLSKTVDILDGSKKVLIGFDGVAIGLKPDISIPDLQEEDAPLKIYKQMPVCPVYLLTDAGFAIASILPSPQEPPILALAQKIRQMLPAQEVEIWEARGSRWIQTIVYPPIEAESTV